MAEHYALNKDMLGDFKKFLDRNCIAFRPGKGEHQILQVRVSKGWGILHTNQRTPDHFTVSLNLNSIIEAFMKTLDK